MKAFLIIINALISIAAAFLSYHYFVVSDINPDARFACGCMWGFSALVSAATFGMRLANA